MKRWRHQGVYYFQSNALYLKDKRLGPKEKHCKPNNADRTNRININPPGDYFKESGNPNLTAINEALDKLEEEEEEAREREEEAREREEKARETEDEVRKREEEVRVREEEARERERSK